MPVVDYCYYIDSSMCTDPPHAVKVHRVGLDNEGDITEVQTQWVEIDRKIANGHLLTGGSVQPTPNGLLFIGGETFYSAPLQFSRIPLGYVSRNRDTGELGDKFLAIQHELSGAVAYCAHCYFTAQNGRGNVFLVYSKAIKLYGCPADFSVYRVAFDAQGQPEKVVREGYLPGDSNVHTEGADCFVRDNKLWVFLKGKNIISPYVMSLNPDGSLDLSSLWRQLTPLSGRPYQQSIRLGQSYAFDTYGGRFFMLSDAYGFDGCVAADIRGDNIVYWAIGYGVKRSGLLNTASMILSHSGKFYALCEADDKNWYWFKANSPEPGPYPLFDFEWKRHSFSSVTVQSRKIRTFYRGGVTYSPPANTAPNTKPALTTPSIPMFYSDLTFSGSASTGVELYGSMNDEPYSKNFITKNPDGTWIYSRPGVTSGLKRVRISAFDQYNNNTYSDVICWVSREPPLIKIRQIDNYKTGFYRVEVSTKSSGLKKIEWAYSSSYTANPSYSQVFESAEDDIIPKVDMIINCPLGQQRSYIYLKSSDIVNNVRESVTFFNTPNYPPNPPSPPAGYPARDGIVVLNTRVAVRAEDIRKGALLPDMNFSIYWKYPPPESPDRWKLMGENFVWYDYSGSGSYTPGEDWGYLAYVYARWEYARRPDENSEDIYFYPATDWFPVEGAFPLRARLSDGTWVGTSVFNITLKEKGNILTRPLVWEKRKNIESPYVLRFTDKDPDELIEPTIWRLRVLASLNAPSSSITLQPVNYSVSLY